MSDIQDCLVNSPRLDFGLMTQEEVRASVKAMEVKAADAAIRHMREEPGDSYFLRKSMENVRYNRGHFGNEADRVAVHRSGYIQLIAEALRRHWTVKGVLWEACMALKELVRGSPERRRAACEADVVKALQPALDRELASEKSLYLSDIVQVLGFICLAGPPVPAARAVLPKLRAHWREDCSKTWKQYVAFCGFAVGRSDAAELQSLKAAGWMEHLDEYAARATDWYSRNEATKAEIMALVEFCKAGATSGYSAKVASLEATADPQGASPTSGATATMKSVWVRQLKKDRSGGFEFAENPFKITGASIADIDDLKNAIKKVAELPVAPFKIDIFQRKEGEWKKADEEASIEGGASKSDCYGYLLPSMASC